MFEGGLRVKVKDAGRKKGEYSIKEIYSITGINQVIEVFQESSTISRLSCVVDRQTFEKCQALE
jgi:hypothetical protein